MRIGFALLLGVSLALMLWTGVDGGEKKEVTIKGQVICAKCGLAIEKKCATVVVEKVKDKKDVIYWFDTPSHKKFHSDICQEAKEGTVVGVVSEKDGKKMIEVKDVKYKK
jgi:hypothetical protein